MSDDQSDFVDMLGLRESGEPVKAGYPHYHGAKLHRERAIEAPGSFGAAPLKFIPECPCGYCGIIRATFSSTWRPND